MVPGAPARRRPAGRFAAASPAALGRRGLLAKDMEMC